MSWMQAIFERVWQVSLSAAVLIGLGWLVIAVFGGRMPAWARYGIWWLVFLRLVVPVVPPAEFSVWNLGSVRGSPATPLTFGRSGGYKPAIQQIENLRYNQKLPVLPLIWIGGVFAWLAAAVTRHRRVARWVQGQGMCTDERVLLVVDRAREAFKVRKSIAVVINQRFEAPAVFGWRRPTLLLPEAWIKHASEDELDGVLLHELAHVKCRDAFLNWVFILVRSLHWFNPLVWHAFRRLRAERELFCDALVLKRLQPPERTAYGNILLKIAAQLSGVPAPSTFVPVLQHKPEIHWRIHMIAKYKSTPWLLSAAFTLLLLALAGITFTRAAEKKGPSAISAPQAFSRAVEVLQGELARQEELVRKLQTQCSKMRAELAERETPGAEALQKLHARRAEVSAEVARLSSLYDSLGKYDRKDLKRTISLAVPDNQLSELMQQQALAEQKLADLLEDRAPAHPDVKRITRVLAQIVKQIDDRIDSIMSGLDARSRAEQALLKELDAQMAGVRNAYVEGLGRARPYEESLQQLRAQEEILQRLRLRMSDERINNALERAKQR